MLRRECRHLSSVRVSASDVSADSEKKVALRVAAERRVGGTRAPPRRTARATKLVKLDGGGPVRANGASMVACLIR